MDYNFNITKQANRISDAPIKHFLVALQNNPVTDIKFYTIFGKTGAGKDAILDLVMDLTSEIYLENQQIEIMKMSTTRKPRNKDDDKYIFRSVPPKPIEAIDLRCYKDAYGQNIYFWFDIMQLINMIAKCEEDTLKIIFPSATIETILSLKALIYRLIIETARENILRNPIELCNIYIERDNENRYLSLMKREAEKEEPDIKDLIRRIELDDDQFAEQYVDFFANYRIFNEENNQLQAVKELINIIS